MAAKRRDVYQRRITLRGSQPRIWRRVEVPGDYSLVGLHQVVQVAMGWEDEHLHSFAKDTGLRRYPARDALIPEEDEPYVGVSDVFPREGSRIQYHYVFGDNWLHDLTLEERIEEQDGRTYPICTAGRGACPPEDVGGIGRYCYLVEGFDDPDHPAFGELAEWCGVDFDPREFYQEAVNGLFQIYA